MGKSYLDDLAEWVDKRPKKKKRQQDAAVVAFLAVRADIKTALDAGYSMTTIWEHMRDIGKLKCSYETFRIHVQRYIKKEVTTKMVNQNWDTPVPESDSKKQKASKEPKKVEPAISGFTFDAKPNKEELL